MLAEPISENRASLLPSDKAAESRGAPPRCWPRWAIWLFLWSATSSLAVVGVVFGNEFVKSKTRWNLLDEFARRDGQHYKQIVERGYEYHVGRQSVVAFFPAYPLLARALAWLTGLNSVWAMLVVSNLSLLAAFALMEIYLQGHSASDGLVHSDLAENANPRQSLDAGTFALLAMGVFPTAVFFRMAYSESMFLCVCILCMLGIRRGWPLPAIALLVGLATAVRPVGVALVLPMAWHVARRSDSKASIVRRLAYSIPLGCWGLIAYMAFQYARFGEPFAFSLTQQNWRIRPDTGLFNKLWSLVSWEPIWSVYNTQAAGYWRHFDGAASALFSLQFANPIYFVGAICLVAVGAWKKWLNSYEILLSVGLLAIPYATRAYEMGMVSQGRYAAVVFPVYIVLGQLLGRLPAAVAIALLILSGGLMVLYAALFAMDYLII